MPYQQAFKPLNGGPQGLANAFCRGATTTVSTTTQFVTQAAGTPSQIQIQNTCTTANLWLNFGPSSGITAAAVPSTTNIPVIGVPPGCTIAYTMDPSWQWVSWILDGTGSTGTVVISLGEGM